MKIPLPSEYQIYLGKGIDTAFTKGEPGYFQLWPADEIEQMNQDYKVSEYASGFLGFGSDGGGEMLAFDASGSVFMIPFVGMEPCYARKIASSWKEIVNRISDDEE